jgi:two-component system nitrate/nitrite response regulator NarL
MIQHPGSEVREILILKADRLCANILHQTALIVFPSAVARVATSIAEVISALESRTVDLLLTGVGLVDGDTLDLLAESEAERKFRRALVVTGRREQRVLVTLRALPISGVFDPMSEDMVQLEAAIRTVGGGGRYWSPSVQARLTSKNSSSPGSLCALLSPTEQLVFAVIGDGSDDRVAADRLNLKPSTIHSVRRELHRKLGVQHKGELVRMAVQHGYVRFTEEGVQRPGFSSLLAACGRAGADGSAFPVEIRGSRPASTRSTHV